MPLVAFRIGNEPVFTYVVLLNVGLVLAVLHLALEGQRRGWGRLLMLEIVAWALVPGVLLGRLAHVVGQAPELVTQPWQAQPWQAQPWGDGISFPGALLGGALGLALLAAWRRQPCLALLGAIVPGLALGQTLGWLGAAVHGAQAGQALPLATWWAPHLRDLYGVVVPRFPLQYMVAGLSLLMWAVTAWVRLGDAQRVACYSSLSGGGLAALARRLERRLPLLYGLSLDQVLYLAIALAGLAVALWAAGTRPRPRTTYTTGA